MLTIERPLLNQLLKHLQNCYPLEGCGLLAGDEETGGVTAVYPIENSLHSPTAYEMDPTQQIQAMLDLETHGWQLLAIYHSHPQGPEVPSATDVALAMYPDAMYVIVSLQKRAGPVVRAFRIDGQVVVEQSMRVV
ncbi:MAG: M67 family metallopeptidase [Anaerolineaceae bacterium]|nr:M67 family metallopeptidase [Anaerolineaceae bacterium]